MTISALSGGQSWDIMRQRRAALQQMEAAVQSGDIKSAQQGLAKVQSLSPAASSGGSSGTDADGDGDGGNPFRSTMKADLSALETAVGAGNIADAQSALSKLTSDRQAHKAQEQGASGTATVLGTDLVKLLDAALKGDTSGAQEAAKALQGDLQSALGTSASSDGGSTATSSGNPLIDDLKALVSAGQGTDAKATQAAAQKFVQDLQQSSGGGGNAPVAHHHHGHHAHVVAQYEQMSVSTVEVSSNTPSAPASDATAPATSVG